MYHFATMIKHELEIYFSDLEKTLTFISPRRSNVSSIQGSHVSKLHINIIKDKYEVGSNHRPFTSSKNILLPYSNNRLLWSGKWYFKSAGE